MNGKGLMKENLDLMREKFVMIPIPGRKEIFASCQRSMDAADKILKFTHCILKFSKSFSYSLLRNYILTTCNE